MKSRHPAATQRLEAVILAGGTSSRMGADKARLRLRGRTMLALVRDAARDAGLPVRVIRRDAVPRCGPVGGIFTALSRSRAEAILFLACDMPFISPALLRKVIRASRGGRRAAACRQEGRIGFPLVVPNSALSQVAEHIRRGTWSVRELADALGSVTVAVPRTSRELFNINTPADRAEAKRLLESPRGNAKSSRRLLSR